MKRILYLDTSAGVSGDMFVGALLDAGADLERVRGHVNALGVGGIRLDARKVKRHGLVGTKFDVLDPESGRSVDGLGEGDVPGSSSHHHGQARGHGHTHTHRQGSTAAHVHEPIHARGHGREHRNLDRNDRDGLSADHPHRGLFEVRRLIERAGLPDPVARDALGVFELLARAEAKVHGTTVDAVHFHEVGALDAIADIVAGVSAFHDLGVDEVWCSPLHVGCGTVRCAHGTLPVPAPATAELLKGTPVYSDGTRGELVTPTGAALVRHLFDGFGPMPPLVVETVGYGAGTKDFGIPNLLRASVGRACAGQRPLHAATVG